MASLLVEVDEKEVVRLNDGAIIQLKESIFRNFPCAFRRDRFQFIHILILKDHHMGQIGSYAFRQPHRTACIRLGGEEQGTA